MRKESGSVSPEFVVLGLICFISWFVASSIQLPERSTPVREHGQMVFTKSPDVVHVYTRVIDLTGDLACTTEQAMDFGRYLAKALTTNTDAEHVQVIVRHQPQPCTIFEHVLDRQNTFVISIIVWP